MKVLLVDDEKEIVSTLAERLSFRGIEAVWVTSGEEALKKLETEQFDLAILDVKMPKMNGLRLEKKIKENYQDLKYMFLTARGADEDPELASNLAGKENYLSKPIKIDKLLNKINEVLNL